MNKRVIWKSIIAFAFAAVVILAAVRPDGVLAYFTTHAEAEGARKLVLGHDSHIDEEFSNGEKVVTITSEEGSVPVFVRVRAFCEYGLGYDYNAGTWEPGPNAPDDYYYYTSILEEGQSTEPIKISTEYVKVGEGHKEGDSFDIIVVYETTPVVFSNEEDAEGNPIPVTDYNDDATWKRKVERDRTSYKVSGE